MDEGPSEAAGHRGVTLRYCGGAAAGAADVCLFAVGTGNLKQKGREKRQEKRKQSLGRSKIELL